MLPSFARQQVTIHRPGTTTKRGQTVPDYANETTHTINGCSVQPGDTSTGYNAPGREVVTIKATLYAPQGSDIRAGDTVEYSGSKYSIDGDPVTWVSAFGGFDHMVVKLVEWRG